MTKKAALYDALILWVFDQHDHSGAFDFEREELERAAQKLKLVPPKNLGDVIYTYRYRRSLPQAIVDAAPVRTEWIILPAGRARYRFQPSAHAWIQPRTGLRTVRIPDATPEIVSATAFGDEQALLARLRYNRLIDMFLGITAYSLQNHLRTTITDVGQIEIDELYVGVDRHGAQYIVPVQAKGGSDKIGYVQTWQDLRFCAEKFPNREAVAISAQFIDADRIAIFHLNIGENDDLEIVEERHYELCPSEDISVNDLRTYGTEARRRRQ